MIVFVGASASGKTELAKTLFKAYGYEKCITTTTRPMRSHERQGVDYHFIDPETFLAMQERGEFIEVTYYQENLYGIQKKSVDVNGVVIVDPAGANHLIEALKEQVYVVYVESSEAIRRKRMLERGDEPEMVEKRIFADQYVFHPDAIKRINLYIKNDEHGLMELADQIHNAYQAYLLAHDL